MRTASILVLDDDASFREAIVELLRDAGHHVQDGASGGAGESLLLQERFDLVVADIEMPGNRQLQFLHKLVLREVAVPVIVVTGHPSLRTAIDAVRLPVTAYLLKPVNNRELLDEVVKALSGAQLTRAGASPCDRLEVMGGRWALTPRQREVLSLVVKGHANKEVASALGCSLRTVELHVSALLEKTAADSRTELLARFFHGS